MAVIPPEIKIESVQKSPLPPTLPNSNVQLPKPIIIIPESRKVELYDQGYSISDMQIAEACSQYCNKSPEEILQMRGIASPNSRSWSSIKSELMIPDFF